MKALLKKSIVLALASLFTISVSAQKPERKHNSMTPEDRASKQTEMMTKQLELTADQQAKIKEINLKYSQQMANNREQAKEERKKDMDNLKAQMEAKDTEFKQVLTPEQYQKWQDNKHEMKKNIKNRAKKHNKMKE